MRRWSWPWVRRAELEATQQRNAALERRLFVLRDNIKQGIWRVKMNLSLSENANAERILTMALVRDLEHDQSTGEPE